MGGSRLGCKIEQASTLLRAGRGSLVWVFGGGVELLLPACHIFHHPQLDWVNAPPVLPVPELPKLGGGQSGGLMGAVLQQSAWEQANIYPIDKQLHYWIGTLIAVVVGEWQRTVSRCRTANMLNVGKLVWQCVEARTH
jgi:hypothetical protein